MTVRADPKDGDTCDWCGAQGVVIAWPVPEIHGIDADGSSTVFVAEQGTWAACSACRQLVEAHDVDGLADRADVTYGAMCSPELRRHLHAQMRAMFALIDQVRGAAVPVASWREWVR